MNEDNFVLIKTPALVVTVDNTKTIYDTYNLTENADDIKAALTVDKIAEDGTKTEGIEFTVTDFDPATGKVKVKESSGTLTGEATVTVTEDKIASIAVTGTGFEVFDAGETLADKLTVTATCDSGATKVLTYGSNPKLGYTFKDLPATGLAKDATSITVESVAADKDGAKVTGTLDNITVSAKEITPTVTIEPVEGNFEDGHDYLNDIHVTVSYGTGNDKVTLTEDTDYELVWTDSNGDAVTELTDVGIYTVTATAVADGNYTFKADNAPYKAEFNLKKAAQSGDVVIGGVPSSWTYGTPVILTVSGGSGGGALSLTASDGTTTFDIKAGTVAANNASAQFIVTPKKTLAATDTAVTLTATRDGGDNLDEKTAEQDVTVIGKRQVSAIWTGDTTYTYDGTDHASGITAKVASGLVDGDSVALKTTIKKGNDTVTEIQNAGTYTLTAALDDDNAGTNQDCYEVAESSLTRTVTINKATLEITGADLTCGDITFDAGDANNTEAKIQGKVETDYDSIDITFGGSTISLEPTWTADTANNWQAQGGTYSFSAALALSDADAVNFEAISTSMKATAKVIVTPVTAALTLSTTSSTKLGSEVAALTTPAFADLGLPATATVACTPSGTYPTSFNIVGWKDAAGNEVTAAAIKTAAEGLDDADLTYVLTPVFDDVGETNAPPAWLTMPANYPTFTLTITPNTPVTVTVTKVPASITYGDTIKTVPAGTGDDGETFTVAQTAIDAGGTATDPTYTFSYQGTGNTTYGPSATAPTDAGDYIVTATMVSSTHSGAGSLAFSIAKKDISSADVTVTLPESGLTYNGQPQTPASVVVKLAAADENALDGTKDYDLTYSNHTNASANATVTVTGKGNYTGTATKKYTIAPLPLVEKTAGSGNTTITGIEASYPYTGGAVTPTVTIQVDGIGLLTVDQDYTVNITGNSTVGEATVTIADVANSNFTFADITKTFQITKGAFGGTVTLKVSSDSGTQGTIDAGDVLTADLTGLVGEQTEGNLDFTWKLIKADGTETALTTGVNGKEYTIQSGDAGKIEVSVAPKADSSNYTGPAVTSNQVEVGKAPAPTTASITISAVASTNSEGGLTVTMTAQLTNGGGSTTVAELSMSFQVQWYCNGAAIGTPVAISADGVANFPAGMSPEGGKSYSCAAVPAASVPAGATEYSGIIASSGGDQTASSGSTVTGGKVNVPASKPAKPANVQAQSGDGKVTVSWDPLVSNGSPITALKVVCKTSDGAVAKTVPVTNLTARSIEITGLTNGTAYTFEVIATNSTGDSPAGTASATPTATVTPPPVVDPTTPTYPSGGSGSGSSSNDDDDETVTIRSSSRDHGTVRLSSSSARKGDTVTVTVKPDRGYEVDEVLVYSSSGTRLDVRSIGGDEYTFTMPSGTVRVEVTYKRTGSTTQSGFTDVPAGYWAADAIRWVSENGYMMGNSAVTFNPEGRVTRQQLWMILARMAGSNPYDFSDARAWAIANGISDGSNPGSSVTRQQMVAILYRYAQMMDYRTTGGTDLSAFPDSGSVASYAQEALQWSVGNGIVGGTASGTLNPGGTATRAQFATILQRFYANVAR